MWIQWELMGHSIDENLHWKPWVFKLPDWLGFAVGFPIQFWELNRSR